MDRRFRPLFLLLFLSLAGHAAGDGPIDRATLKGLEGVGVIIDVIDPELEKLGVTRDTILTHMLARLSTDRIHVNPGATEFLGLRITAVRAGRGPFAVSIALGIYQPVLLSRNREVRTSTDTWGVETVLLADPKVLIPACNDSTDELIDRFASAFRSANPE